MKRTSKKLERPIYKRKPIENKDDLVAALLDARRLGQVTGGFCIPKICWDEPGD